MRAARVSKRYDKTSLRWYPHPSPLVLLAALVSVQCKLLIFTQQNPLKKGRLDRSKFISLAVRSLAFAGINILLGRSESALRAKGGELRLSHFKTPIASRKLM
jgi:hypothetical protein